MKDFRGIKERLSASLKLDAINGDSFERSVVSRQAHEAVEYIGNLESQIIDMRHDNQLASDLLKQQSSRLRSENERLVDSINLALVYLNTICNIRDMDWKKQSEAEGVIDSIVDDLRLAVIEYTIQ